jgi:hypothetical protein
MWPAAWFSKITRTLNLDRQSSRRGELFVPADRRRRRTLHRAATQYLHRVVGQAMDDAALGMNLFYDAEDHALRALEYRGTGGGDNVDHFEFLPAPEPLARPILDWFRPLVPARGRCRERVLRFRYHGQWHNATVELKGSDEVRVFFTEQRFPMRRKGVPPSQESKT